MYCVFMLIELNSIAKVVRRLDLFTQVTVLYDVL